MSGCLYILRKGQNQGKYCGKECILGYNACITHKHIKELIGISDEFLLILNKGNIQEVTNFMSNHRDLFKLYFTQILKYDFDKNIYYYFIDNIDDILFLYINVLTHDRYDVLEYLVESKKFKKIDKLVIKESITQQDLSFINTLAINKFFTPYQLAIILKAIKMGYKNRQNKIDLVEQVLIRFNNESMSILNISLGIPLLRPS